jgi:Thymidine kinase
MAFLRPVLVEVWGAPLALYVLHALRADVFVLCRTGSESGVSVTDVPTAPGASLLGRIDLIVGPMFAGKTSALLQRVHELEVFCLRVSTRILFMAAE